MRRFVFVLCVLGFIFLIVGSVLAVPSVRDSFGTKTISTSGTIVGRDGAPQQVNNGTSLDLLGYAVVAASFGFFAVAFLWNRRQA